MKILHLCLSNFYIDGYAYQENMLVAEHVKAGHDVHVIASTETFGPDGKLTYVAPGSYVGSDGATVQRLQYCFEYLPRLARKIRAFPNIKSRLAAMSPDVIIFHGLCAWALLSVSRYVRDNRNVVLYADSHEDFNNSARNWPSKWILHYLFYRTIFLISLPAIRKVLCISKETELFVENFYGCPQKKLVFLPLGGNIPSDSDYKATRSLVRTEYGWSSDLRIFVQSGKFDSAKRIIESLTAFSALPDKNIRLVLAGIFMQDVKEQAEHLVNSDERIIYLGWLDSKDLSRVLIGGDVYLQPGSQSATMQMALCCRKPVIVADVISHRALISSNGWLINSKFTILDALKTAVGIDDSHLALMSTQSAEVSRDLLDYSTQAKNLTQSQYFK